MQFFHQMYIVVCIYFSMKSSFHITSNCSEWFPQVAVSDVTAVLDTFFKWFLLSSNTTELKDWQYNHALTSPCILLTWHYMALLAASYIQTRSVPILSLITRAKTKLQGRPTGERWAEDCVKETCLKFGQQLTEGKQQHAHVRTATLAYTYSNTHEYVQQHLHVRTDIWRKVVELDIGVLPLITFITRRETFS